MLEQLVRPLCLQLETNSASVQPHSGLATGGQLGAYTWGNKEKLVETQNWSGPSLRTCQNVGTTCKAFQFCRHRENLSFVIHATFASMKLKREIAKSLLDYRHKEGIE